MLVRLSTAGYISVGADRPWPIRFVQQKWFTCSHV